MVAFFGDTQFVRSSQRQWKAARSAARAPKGIASDCTRSLNDGPICSHASRVSSRRSCLLCGRQSRSRPVADATGVAERFWTERSHPPLREDGNKGGGGDTHVSLETSAFKSAVGAGIVHHEQRKRGACGGDENTSAGAGARTCGVFSKPHSRQPLLNFLPVCGSTLEAAGAAKEPQPLRFDTTV